MKEPINSYKVSNEEVVLPESKLSHKVQDFNTKISQDTKIPYKITADSSKILSSSFLGNPGKKIVSK